MSLPLVVLVIIAIVIVVGYSSGYCINQFLDLAATLCIQMRKEHTVPTIPRYAYCIEMHIYSKIVMGRVRTLSLGGGGIANC